MVRDEAKMIGAAMAIKRDELVTVRSHSCTYICPAHMKRTVPAWGLEYVKGVLTAVEMERCAICGVKREKEGGDGN